MHASLKYRKSLGRTRSPSWIGYTSSKARLCSAQMDNAPLMTSAIDKVVNALSPQTGSLELQLLLGNQRQTDGYLLSLLEKMDALKDRQTTETKLPTDVYLERMQALEVQLQSTQRAQNVINKKLIEKLAGQRGNDSPASGSCS